jgi:hypothetical protein
MVTQGQTASLRAVFLRTQARAACGGKDRPVNNASRWVGAGRRDGADRPSQSRGAGTATVEMLWAMCAYALSLPGP